MPHLTPPRRLLLLCGLAAVVGVAGGAAAYVLVHLIALLTNLAFFHRVAWTLPSFTHLQRSPGIILVAVAGGLIVAVIARWAPIIRGHGIPEAMEAVLTRQSRIAPRTAIAKPASAAIAIGSGGPFGAEGPIIVTGGAIGSLLGQLVSVSPSERKILLASGAAAGMAATFGAPLAAVVLAVELLIFEFSTRALIPLMISASIAAGMHSLFFGSGPLFSVPAHRFAGLSQLPFYAVLGLSCGLLAVVINKGLFAIEDGFRRLPVSQFWWPAIRAVGFASVGLVVPRALGVGYDQIGDVLNGRLAVGALAVLLLAKLVVLWVALASGTSGGTLAPILLISGCFGALVGHLAQSVPGVHASVGAFALVAMAATFGAATRATFTSIVFLFELTRDYNAILPLMLSTVLAVLLASSVSRDSIMTEKLTRRGLRVPSDYHADILRTTTVGTVMTESVDTTRRDAAVAAVTDVADAAGLKVVSVRSTDTVSDALERMLEEDVEHLPVIDDGRLVGICNRSDIMRARREQFVHERTEPGWLSRKPRIARP